MKLTPLDIHHKEFGHALRGYNEAEVDAFLDQVADELERLFKENIDLSEKIEGLEEKVRTYQDMERTLHNTLLSAQKSADEMMVKAQREAEAVLKDAEVKAKEVIHAALTSKQKATSDLARVKQAEEEFRSRYKALLEQQLRSLAEVPLPQDVTLMIGQAGEETVSDAEVAAPAPRSMPSYAESVSAQLEPETTFAPEPAPEPEPERPADPGVVASLHLGDLGDADLEPDTTMEFNVAEFGFGDREDDVDIEEID
jgi:cell division initiation protein